MNEAERNDLEKRLYQVSKMETMGVLTSGIAHDFNNTLTTILGCTGSALMETNQNTVYNELTRIQSAAQHAVALTRQLLLFNRQSSIVYELQDINIIISELMEVMSHLIGENIIVSLDLCTNPRMVKAQRVGLEQVISNLVLNARDAMPNGGEVVIKTENFNLSDENDKAIFENPNNDYFRLSISDTGVGMKPEISRRIFDPFFSTKDPDKGTGLGLYIVQNIIKKYNGWINVNSKEGEGTTFEICFPAMKELCKSESQ